MGKFYVQLLADKGKCPGNIQGVCPDPGATSGFMFDLVFADEDRRRQEVVGSADRWNWWRNVDDGSSLLFLLKTEKKLSTPGAV